jgi:hypothetical protein
MTFPRKLQVGGDLFFHSYDTREPQMMRREMVYGEMVAVFGQCANREMG